MIPRYEAHRVLQKLVVAAEQTAALLREIARNEVELTSAMGIFRGYSLVEDALDVPGVAPVSLADAR